jgi:hypothetical protein
MPQFIKPIFRIVKWLIFLVGLLYLLQFLWSRIVISEFYSVNKELKSNENVESYLFYTYDWGTKNFEIWSAGGGYIDTFGVGIEDFQGVSFNTIFQIGSHRLKCFTGEKVDHPVGNKDLAIGIHSLGVAVHNDYEFNLHKVINNYDAIEKLVSNWPNTEETAITINFDPKSVQRAGLSYSVRSIKCWKEEKQQPRPPLYQNMTVRKRGIWFYRR